MSWSPKGNLIAGSTIQGMIIIWDTFRAKEVARFKHHVKPSFSVSWSSLDPNLLVSTSSDATAVVFELMDSMVKEASTSEILGSSNVKRNVSKTPLVMKFTHPAPVFGCSWSPFKAKTFCTGSQDGIARVFDCSQGTSPLYTLRGHNARVFNVVWSPLIPSLLASGSDDLSIIVWNLEKSCSSEGNNIVKPKCALFGHSGNVRALSWNYEHKDILLSGSWDRSIRIWDTLNAICLKVITDHAADVYSLVSHASRPFCYLSCSRDSTVRLWELDDIASHLKIIVLLDESLKRIRDPSLESSEEHSSSVLNAKDRDGYFHADLDEEKADIHPIRRVPLTISTPSSSPQLIMRKQNAENFPAASKASPLPAIHSPSAAKKIHFSFSSITGLGKASTSSDAIKISQSELKSNDDKNYAPLPQLIQGIESARISGILKRIDDLETSNNQWINAYRKGEKFLHVFSLFSGNPECIDLWEAAQSVIRSILINDGTDVSKLEFRLTHHRDPGRVFMDGELISKARSDAKKLESTKISKQGSLSSKIVEKLKEAAVIYARMGEFEKYCGLMLEIGEWTKAIAMAPMVSMEFWENLNNRYADFLNEQSNEDCIPHMIACGNYEHAMDFYLSRNDSRNALLVIKSCGEVRKPEYIRKPQTEDSKSSLKDNLIQRAAWRIADDDIRSGNCVLGAAQLLACTGDYDAAIDILSCCYEDELAYALAYCFNTEIVVVTKLLAYRCARRGLVSVALELMGRINPPPQALGLLLSYACRTDEQAGLFVIAHKLMPVQHWLEVSGKVDEESTCEKVMQLVCARAFAQGCKLACGYLKTHVRETLSSDSVASNIINSLKHAQLHEVEGQLKSQALALLLWFCSFEAAISGNYMIAANMIRILRASSFGSLPLSPTDLLLQVRRR